jgi:hypothetical protein
MMNRACCAACALVILSKRSGKYPIIETDGYNISIAFTDEIGVCNPIANIRYFHKKLGDFIDKLIEEASNAMILKRQVDCCRNCCHLDCENYYCKISKDLTCPDLVCNSYSRRYVQ